MSHKGLTARGSPITEIKHATPPRPNGSALPSSPSSQRLRRVAPSPIHIVSYSQLRYSPESPTRLTAESLGGRHLEYQTRVLGEEGRPSIASGVSEVFSDLTPSELAMEDGAQMSRGEYVRTHYAREVMVDFLTDVFGPTSVTPPSPRAPQLPSFSVVERSSAIPPVNRGSLHGSFATFGRNHSDHSIVPDRLRRDTDADAWSISLSAYDRDDNRGDLPRSESEDLQSDLAPALVTGYDNSPATIDTDLVTPDQGLAPLPEHAGEEQETPTRPRAKVADRPSHGLQLSLTGLIDIDDWRCANAGVTPGPSGRRHLATDVASAPPVPKIIPHSKPDNVTSSHIDCTPPLVSKTHPNDRDLPDALADLDRSTFVDVCVAQEGGVERTTRLPFRRISRPQVWQEKEETALATAWKWNDPPPKPQPFQQTGCLVFGQPPRERDKWIFHHDGARSMPTIEMLSVNGEKHLDFTAGVVQLAIDDFGVYYACGYDLYGRIEWQFEYLVIHRTDEMGNILPDDRIVCPMHFYAARSFLTASRAHDFVPGVIPQHAPTAIVSERMTPPRLGRPPCPPLPVLSPQPYPTPKAERRVRNETSPPQVGRGLDPRHEMQIYAPISSIAMRNVETSGTSDVADPRFADPAIAAGRIDSSDLSSAPTTSSSSSGGKMSGFLQKFGAKSRSRPASRGQAVSPDGPNSLTGVLSGPTPTPIPSRPESVKSGKTRARAASLLSRMTRPFTPPSKDIEKGFSTGPRITPMRSFASLKQESSPRYGDSPPVPALPAGFTISRPRSDTRTHQASSHPFATALKPASSPAEVSVLGVSAITQEGLHAKHYIVTPSKLRPASTILAPSNLGEVQRSKQVGGGLAPPRRPILRKRPSTADPCMDPAGRLVARTPM